MSETDDWLYPYTGEAIVGRLRDYLSSPEYKAPLLPSVALELQELARQPNVQLSKVTEVLEHDSMLAGQVLRVARSPLYGAHQTVRSVNDAVVQLGLNHVRNIVWEMAFDGKLFRSKEFAGPLEMVRKHVVATAHIARKIAEFTSVPTDYAFLCGLMHDIGIAATLTMLGERKANKLKQDKKMLVLILRKFHENASATIAKLWDLPADLQLVVGHHHSLMMAGQVHPVAALVCIAQELATELGAGIELGVSDHCDRAEPFLVTHAYNALQFSDKQRRLIEADAEQVMQRLA